MTSENPELAELLLHEEELQFATLHQHDGVGPRPAHWSMPRVGTALAVTIDVRRGDQQLFHAALPGTAPNNDIWIERKNRVVRRFGHSSFYVRHKAPGSTAPTSSPTSPSTPASTRPTGGAFPIIVRDVGVVGTVTVSGLPQEDDHRLVVDTLGAVLADRRHDAAGRTVVRPAVAGER